MADSSFWDFANHLYAQPGVADACLWLQDQRNLDVMLVLFCLWSGHGRGTLTQETLQQLCAATEPLCRTVIKPLRAVRRWLKQQPGNGENGSGIDNLSSAVRTSELLAEQRQAQLLVQTLGSAGCSVTSETGTAAARANLDFYFAITDTVLDQRVIQRREVLLSAVTNCPRP